MLTFPINSHALNCDFFLSFPCWSLIFSSGWFILSNMIQAYMYGFFKNKRIVLYDTLIQQVFKLFHVQYIFFILFVPWIAGVLLIRNEEKFMENLLFEFIKMITELLEYFQWVTSLSSIFLILSFINFFISSGQNLASVSTIYILYIFTHRFVFEHCLLLCFCDKFTFWILFGCFFFNVMIPLITISFCRGEMKCYSLVHTNVWTHFCRGWLATKKFFSSFKLIKYLI